MQDLVSIVIPSFNREKYIAQTIDSCLAQTYKNIEIIVVDDGSTDNSIEISRGYLAQDERFILFESVNQGPCVARNIGLSIAKGKYIKFLDSDDLLLPYTIQYQLDSLKHHHADIAIGQTQNFWDDELEAVSSASPQNIQFSASDSSEVLPYLDVVKRGKTTFNEVLLKRAPVLAAGGFHPWLGGANESSLNARLLFNNAELKAVIQPDTLILLKRVGMYSLAAQNRTKKTMPWALISYQKAAEQLLKRRDDVHEKVQAFIFDTLYKQITYAYRNGFEAYADIAYDVLKKANVEPPKLTPPYHQHLHKSLGPKRAETVLSTARKLVKGKPRS